MGDKIVVLRDGLVQQIGTPLGLYNHPANRFVAGFIGSPPMNIVAGQVQVSGGTVIVDEGAFKIELTGEVANAMSAYDGKDILIGVRPEDLEYHETPQKKNCLEAVIDVVEPLGSEIHLNISTDNHQMVARVAPDHNFNVGDTVYFTPNMAKVHFFDLETEQSIIFNEEASRTL